jgi:dipeptidase E
MARIFLTNNSTHIPSVVDLLPFPPAGKQLCLIWTAAKIYPQRPWIEDSRAAWTAAGFSVEMVDISDCSPESAAQSMTRADAVFVAGGNSFFLLQELKRTGLRSAILDLLSIGTPYIGESAGAVVLGPTLEPIQLIGEPAGAPFLESLDGLGILPFVPMIHFGHPEYKEKYQRLIDEYFSSDLSFRILHEREFAVVEGSLVDGTLDSPGFWFHKVYSD